jgi:AAA domain/Primase C terminal 2 (PriCT-2)
MTPERLADQLFAIDNVVPINAQLPSAPHRVIDRSITVTVFPDRYARSKREKVIRFRGIPNAMGKRTAASKDKLPWLKLATFGNEASARGCYRTNANMIAIDGIEGDHDAGTMGVDKALELLRDAGLAGIVYTSASHTPAKPRLRVICPTSVSLLPEQRKPLVARLNGALKGALAGESFNDSLSYYYGRIEGNPHYRVEIIDGRGIDEATELDAGALGRNGKPYRVEIIDGRGIDEATELDAGALGRNGKPYYGQQQPSPVSDDELRPEPDLKFIARAIEFIPVRCRDDREGYWRPVMMALHNAAGGSEEAYRVLDRWSQGDGLDKCKKYDPADQRRVWNLLGHYQPEEQITLGTLFKFCKKHGWNRKQFTSRLQFLTPEDCAAAPARGYIVKGVIAPGDLACIFGPPGAGKSAVAPLIAYHVSRGEPVFGLRTKPGGVFYIAAEDPAGMANRVAALRQRFGDAPEFTLVTGLTDLLDDNSADRAALLDAIDEQQPSIILIDTMAMAFPDLDENDGKEMGRVVRVARSIAARGPAVVLIHHGTKADGSTPRGHSVLNGALDVAIQIVSSDKGGVIRAKDLFMNYRCG